jgi:hypothetical protein
MNRPVFSTRTPFWGALGIALLLAAIAVTPGCLRSSTIEAPQRTELSPKLTPFAYFTEGKVAFIGVDGRAAQYIKEQPIFPLGLGLANHGKGPLRFERESFVLETADGKRYPLAAYEEYTRDYDRGRLDVQLADTFTEALNSRFATYNSVQFRLFPVQGEGGTIMNRIELGRLFWTQTYLYFPVPEDGIHGKQFTLLVTAEGEADRFIVRFELK